MRKVKILFGMVFMLLTMSGASLMAAAATIELPITVDEDYTAAKELLDEINKARVNKFNLHEMQMDAQLQEIAMLRGAELAVAYGHSRPISNLAGVDSEYKNVKAEDIGMGQGSASVIYSNWAGSAGHAPVMHDKNAYSCGIGSVVYESTRYWVLVTSVDKASIQATTTGMKYGVTRNIKVESSRIKFYMWDGSFSFNGSEQVYAGNSVYYGTNTRIGVFIENLYEPSTTGCSVPVSMITFSSDTPSILSVSADGVITPKNTGTGSITVALKSMPDVKTSFPIEVRSNTTFKSPTIMLCVTSFVYNGKPVEPGVTVTDCFGNKLVEARDYTIEFRNNDKAGTGSVRINMLGNYHNPAVGNNDFYTAGFSILENPNVPKTEPSAPGTAGSTGGDNSMGGGSTGGDTADGSSTGGIQKEGIAAQPKPVSISKLQPKSRRKLTVKWKKRSGVSGYQLQYALNKKFTKGKQTKKVSGYKKTSLTLNRLKSRKVYHVRIRTYKKVNGKTYYSSWSKAEKVRVK